MGESVISLFFQAWILTQILKPTAINQWIVQFLINTFVKEKFFARFYYTPLQITFWNQVPMDQYISLCKPLKDLPQFFQSPWTYISFYYSLKFKSRLHNKTNSIQMRPSL